MSYDDSYPSDMADLAMTCSVNALKMLICFDKHLVSKGNHGYTKKVVINRDFISRTIFCKILVYSKIF